MDQKLFLQYLKEYTLEAIEFAEDNVNLAADFLEKKTPPRFPQKDIIEKKAALNRVKKVFSSSRERSSRAVKDVADQRYGDPGMNVDCGRDVARPIDGEVLSQAFDRQLVNGKRCTEAPG